MLLWAVVTLAVVGVALGAVPDSADAQPAGASHFSDDDGSVHEPALDALAARGVLVGIECGDGLICPSEPLKRWEMAVWLVRVLDGAEPGAADNASFSDVDYDAWWAPFVERLFEMGVTVGCRRDPLQYCPDSSVTRAQMATFLKRAFDLEPAPVAGFTDVSGGSHGANIDALAAAGITVGCSRDPLRYCPTRSVTRGQMASFLARALGLIELPSSVRFTAIDAGGGHTCGLRADGSVVCWGDNQHGQAHALDGRFRAVSAGGNHSCGLRSDNTILCWGDNQYGQTGAPTGQFQAVSAGGDHTCGLRTDGTIDCWGYNGFGQANPPEGRFTAVTAGPAATAVSGHSCGLRAAGAIVCWGYNRHGQIDAPDGEFVSVAAGEFHSCAVRLDGKAACWGAGPAGGEWATPQGAFTTVDLGEQHACGVRVDSSIACWAENFDVRTSGRRIPEGGFSSVTVGKSHSCGLRLNGTIDCWGSTGYDLTGAPGGSFNSLSVGWHSACALRTDGKVDCWGSGAGAFPPDGEFSAIASGADRTCGLRTNGTITCWGYTIFGRDDVPPGEFAAVSVESLSVCGLRTNGTITCWGQHTPAATDAPGGQFTAVTGGHGHACGLRTDGAIACWGHNDWGQLKAPDGQFSALSAGGSNTCAVREDGSITCWGREGSGETEAPEGTFSVVAVGSGHSCALRVDGTAVCWGDNRYGQAEAPGGQFKAVAAGGIHSCGLRTDGSIACWGRRLVAAPITVSKVVTSAEPDPAACRPYGLRRITTAGFPRSAALTSGTVRVAVLFVDFPDAAAAHSTHREAELGLPYVEAYLESVSYGQLDIVLEPLHRWLRAEHDHTDYLLADAPAEIAQEAARLADPEFDFSGYDVMMVVMPSSHFGGGIAPGFAITDEGPVSPAVSVNSFVLGAPAQPRPWGTVGAHEFLHAFGLVDMYPDDPRRHRRPNPPAGWQWVRARFGRMGLRGNLLASEQDKRPTLLDASEMLAWNRWQLGWLEEDQIRCVSEPAARVTLSPVAVDPGPGEAMAAIPLSAHELIVMESRRKVGYDSGRTGASLLVEGVLVYTVDAALESGMLPVKLTSDTGDGQLEHYPVLTVGESVTVRGYTITVVADDGDTHTVTIARVGEG